MRQRIAIFSLFIAWLLATGSQWDLMQVFAWGRMFAGYVNTMSVGHALEETFDTDKPCALCLAVGKAKQQEDKTLPPEVRLRDKMLLVFQPVPVLLATTPGTNQWLIHERKPLSTGRASPPVPPPRGEA